jgi:heparanase
MIEPRRIGLGVAALLMAAGGCQRDARGASSASLVPAGMPRVARIDERFQSYNVETLEVTGGKFWKPYGSGPEPVVHSGKPAAAAPGSATPAGMNPDLYQYRPPIDLTKARLRKLAAGLGPAYVRVSGTWANSTYFPDSDNAPKGPRASMES